MNNRSLANSWNHISRIKWKFDPSSVYYSKWLLRLNRIQATQAPKQWIKPKSTPKILHLKLPQGKSPAKITIRNARSQSGPPKIINTRNPNSPVSQSNSKRKTYRKKQSPSHNDLIPTHRPHLLQLLSSKLRRIRTRLNLRRVYHIQKPVSYTHLTLPTNREV